MRYRARPSSSLWRTDARVPDVHYYKHHLGDYAGATDHLSWDEDMAYTRLLRVYYRDEKPLPLVKPQLYRLARASSRAQRAAVDAVLAEFFTQSPEGWHNKRADKEIANDREFIAQQRERAQKRWHGGNGHMPAHVKGNASAYATAMPAQCGVGINPAMPPNPNPNPNPIQKYISNPTPPARSASSRARGEKDAEKGRVGGSFIKIGGEKPDASK